MAKWLNAPDFDSVIREFKSLCPCLFLTLFVLLRLVWRWCTAHILVSVPRYQTRQRLNSFGVNLLTDTLHNFWKSASVVTVGKYAVKDTLSIYWRSMSWLYETAQPLQTYNGRCQKMVHCVCGGCGSIPILAIG